MEKAFGTERVSFHKSTLIGAATNRTKPKITIMEEGSDNSGYKRPAGSIKVNPVSVRVTSHSQPPLGTEKNHYGNAVTNNSSMIPPPTTGQNNNIVLNVKRPVVKMSGISFVSRQSPQPVPDNPNT